MSETLLLEEEVAEETGALSEGQKENLRAVAKNDLFVLSKGILGQKDVNKHTHGQFCRFIQNEERNRRLGMMPRAHLKTSIACVGDSIRLALIDPDDTRILIAGESATTSQKILKEIKDHWEKNKLLRQLFSHLVPSRFSGPGVTWSSDRASILRDSINKDPTWTALGVGGAAVGAHFTRIKCDDLIGFEAFRSPAKMAEAIAWVNNIEPLLTNQHVDIIDFIGTRWKKGDLYDHVMKLYGIDLAVFTLPPIDSQGNITFPAKHTWKEYERLQRETPGVWFSQYLNNPISSSEEDLPVEMVRFFRFNLNGTEVVAVGEGGKEIRHRIDDLDRVLTADPNSGSLTAPDTAAISVQGVSTSDEVFVLESWSGRCSPSQFVDKIYQLAKRWRVRVVGIEKAGQQNTQHYFEKKAQEEDFRLRIEPVKHNNVSKELRIRAAIEPVVRGGRLFVLASHITLRGQIADFPMNANTDSLLVDELDALAYGPQVWRTPMRQQDQEEVSKVITLMLRRRNLRTGY